MTDGSLVCSRPSGIAIQSSRPASEVEGWMDTFVKAGERGLKVRAEDEQAVHEAEASVDASKP